jgi:hypothetical protein
MKLPNLRARAIAQAGGQPIVWVTLDRLRKE